MKCFHCRISEKAYGHRRNEFEDVCFQCALVEVFQQKRKSAHQRAGGENPDNQGKHGQWNTSAFKSYQCKCLGRRGAGQQLTESVIIEQFFFCNVVAAMHKCFQHHTKMTLRSTKSSEAVQEHCFQERYMAEQYHRLIICFSFY